MNEQTNSFTEEMELAERKAKLLKRLENKEGDVKEIEDQIDAINAKLAKAE